MAGCLGCWRQLWESWPLIPLEVMVKNRTGMHGLSSVAPPQVKLSSQDCILSCRSICQWASALGIIVYTLSRISCKLCCSENSSSVWKALSITPSYGEHFACFFFLALKSMIFPIMSLMNAFLRIQIIAIYVEITVTSVFNSHDLIIKTVYIFIPDQKWKEVRYAIPSIQRSLEKTASLKTLV